MFPNWTLDLNENPSDWEFHLNEFMDQCILLPGPETDRIGEVAKSKAIHVVFGANEVEKNYDGVLYNSLVFISSTGAFLGKHRKLFPTSREKIFHARGDASGLKIYETPIGRLGGLICYEHLQPLLKYALIGQGEQIHCASWPGWPNFPQGRSNRNVFDAASKAYALEGQCFVIASSLYVPPSTGDHIDLGNASWTFFGGSGIINPSGEYIAGPLYDEEGIVYGDMDLSLIPRRKATVDTTGRDSAWETINMNIDLSSRKPIHWNQDDNLEELFEKIDMLEKKLQQYKNIDS
ncbi:putative amidohydrolase [Geomicrobium halophilum]|uniref:Putative amidohydrolase n=1 Tax=Geomicrobium halophilum TaxID=549000 RepID=A0A841PXL5_9BACL|nr:putative amidohydrolase [Geomicrobium halophilum]